MTVFGWDCSTYDGLITPAIAARAHAEGIQFATHRLVRQTGELDGNAARSLTAFRDAGVPILGAYTVTHSGTGTPQADATIAAADAVIPWWRDFEYWIWQVDCEKWPTDPVPAQVGIDEGYRLRARTGRFTDLYASHGQYGNSLTGWDGPTWNADYVSAPAAGFKAMYPGDTWMPLHGSLRGGWAPYSGKAPTFLQYTSSATIAGLTTCDANAFRGTLAELLALIKGATDMLTASDVNLIWTSDLPGDAETRSVANVLLDTRAAARAMLAAAAGDETRDAAVLAAVQALATAGGVDAAPIVDAIRDEANKTRTLVEQLQAENADLRARLAAAAQAGAVALNAP